MTVHINDTAVANAVVFLATHAAPGAVDTWTLREVAKEAIAAGQTIGTHNRGALLTRAQERSRAARQPLSQTAQLKTRRSAGDTAVMARTRAVVAELEGVIKAARRQVLGGGPTLPSLDAARAWIEARPDLWGQAGRQAVKARVAVQMAIEALRAVDPFETHTWSSQPRTVEYWRPDGTLGSRAGRRDDAAMNVLCTISTQTAASTGLPAASVTAWILTGTEPGGRTVAAGARRVVLPGIQRVLVRRVAPGRVALELDVRDLSDRHLRAVRQELAAAVDGAAAEAPLSASHRALVEAVNALGGAPRQRFSRAFWRQVAAQIGQRHADPVGLARRYYRASGIPSK